MAKRKDSKKKDELKPKKRIFKWIPIIAILGALGFGNWFSHQPSEARARWGSLEPTLESLGAITADFTDNLGLTGHDLSIPYNATVDSGTTFPFGQPKVIDSKLVPKDVVVQKRTGYTIAFSPTLGHPIWSAYAVPAKKKMEFPPARPNHFDEDKAISGSPVHEQYSGSGYDRGHMAPNYVIATRYGKKAQLATFLMTNISPQTPGLNRGPWKDMERIVADDLSGIGDTLYVITGAIPDKNPKKVLPKTHIRIPASFYKVIAAVHEGKLRAIGIVMDQSINPKANPRYSIRSIASIEKACGLDFFPLLPQEQQDVLEKTEPTRFWPSRALIK